MSDEVFGAMARRYGLASGGRVSDDYRGMDDQRATTVPDDRRDLGLAVLVAEAESHAYEPVSIVSTLREAIELSAKDFQSRCASVEAGTDRLCPSSYVVWSRNQGGEYRRLHAISADDLLTAESAPHPDTSRATAPACLTPNMTLILTTEGFLNVDQVCEYRLRYVDPSSTDAVWAIDVLLSNGTSHLIAYQDPGFDQLIDIFEEQGYTISVGAPR